MSFDNTFTVDNLTVSENLVSLTFEIIEFIDTDHQSFTLIKFATKNKLAELTLTQFKSSIFSDTDRTQVMFEAFKLHS